MIPLIVDADAEQLLVDYLTTALPVQGITCSVSTTVPNPRLPESVVLYRTGGARRDLITDRPQLTFEIRAGLESRAYFVASMVRALLGNLDGNGVVLGGHAIYGFTEMNGPYSDFDPVGNSPRYSMTGWVDIRST